MFHFLIAGALLFVLYDLFNEDNTKTNTVKVSLQQANQLAENWQRKTGKKPTAAEWNSLIERHVHEIILANEAKENGLGENDPIIRRRLAQKIEFILDDQLVLQETPKDSLYAFYKDNDSKYKSPLRISFKQLYFSSEKAALNFASSIAEQKQSHADLQQFSTYQNNSNLPGHYQHVSIESVSRSLGKKFSDTLVNAPPRKWHGPIQSGMGWHWVFIHEIREGSLLPFKEIKKQVERDYRYEQSKKYREEKIQTLKSNYSIHYSKALQKQLNEAL